MARKQTIGFEGTGRSAGQFIGDIGGNIDKLRDALIYMHSFTSSAGMLLDELKKPNVDLKKVQKIVEIVSASHEQAVRAWGEASD